MDVNSVLGKNEIGRKCIQLIEYIKALEAYKTKDIKLSISESLKSISISDIPENSKYIYNGLNVQDFEDIKNEVIDDEDCKVLLEVFKVNRNPCPEPPIEIRDVLESKWKSSFENITLEEILNLIHDENINTLDIATWIHNRDSWIEEDQYLYKVDQLFSKLQQINNTIKSDSDNIEFILGNALINNLDKSICYPIIYSNVRIRFISETNSMQVYCPMNRVKFSEELSYSKHEDLSDLDWRNLVEFKQETELLEFVIGNDEIEPFITHNIHALNSDIKIFNSKDELIEYTNMTLYVVFEPIFLLRRVNRNNLAFLNTISECIKSDKLSGKLLDIVVGEAASNDLGHIKPRKDWGAINGQASDVFFTKPANRAQLEIIDYIDHNKSVVVQGPPGTGKTHTIANLIGHYLAKGKTILVTSSTSKALSVLRDKLPKEIRPLCVPLLDEGESEVTKAISIISEQLQQYNSDRYRININNLIGEYEHSYIELETLRKKLFSVKCKESRYLSIQNEPISIKDAIDAILSIPVKDYEYWDNINCQLNFPLNIKEYDFLVTYKKQIQSNLDEDQILIQQSEVAINDIPLVNMIEDNYKLKESVTNKLKELCFDLNSLLENEVETYFEHQSIDIKLNDVLIPEELIIKLKCLNQSRYKFTNSYWIELAGDTLAGTEDLNRWKKLYESIDEGILLYNAYYDNGIDVSSVSVDNSVISPQSKDIIDTIVDLLKNPPNFIYRLLKSIDVEAECSRIKINGKVISTLEECDSLYKVIDYINWKEQFKSLWNELVGQHIDEYSFDSIVSYTKGKNVALWCKEHVLSQIETAKSWYKLGVAPVIELFKAFGINLLLKDNILTTPSKRVENLNDTLGKLYDVFLCFDSLKQNEFERWRQNNNTFETQLENLMLNTENKITNGLYNSFLKNDFVKYQSYYKLSEYAINNADNKKEFDRILLLLENITPRWADLIKKDNNLELESYSEIQKVWFAKQCESAYKDNFSEDYDTLLEKIQRHSASLLDLARKIVVNKAWYERSLATANNKDIHTALASWVALMKKIGKGTGKSAPIYRKQALEQLAIAKDAIPCWIMPINKIYNTINPANMSFDLIIVDEASQADINALPILALGEKVIIVGDDKQVSPSGIVRIRDEEIHSLQNNYLISIPNRVLFDFKTSLYEFVRPLSRQVMLKEHFRCVSAIINYSNKYYYDNNIVPLRDDSISPLKTPIVPVYVDGFREGKSKINSAEAEYIVSAIEACFKNSAYNDLSFGVISLLGNEQSEYIYNLLVERCNPADVESHNLICGDAAQFQGDERDVIFLSLVDAKNIESENSLVRKIDVSNVIFRQRFNVAVSRAKNQLWVVYSMEPDLLSDDDIRKNLLNYCDSYHKISYLTSEAHAVSESPFELEVASYLIGKGYKIKQQYPVGNYRLDMIVEYNDKKIAIECDGEAYHSSDEQIRKDLERQIILERIGWSFIRIRGSEYYKSKNNTLESLEEQLLLKGICPYENNIGEIVTDSVVSEIKNEIQKLFESNKDKSFKVRDLDDVLLVNKELNSDGDNSSEGLICPTKQHNNIDPHDFEENGNQESLGVQVQEEFNFNVFNEEFHSVDNDKHMEKSRNTEQLEYSECRNGIKEGVNTNGIPKEQVINRKNSSSLESRFALKSNGSKNVKERNTVSDLNKCFFGDLGYIFADDYHKLMEEAHRKESGKQKNFFNKNMIKVGAIVYNNKNGIGVINTISKDLKVIKVIFYKDNKQEIYIGPSCFIQEKLILLKGCLQPVL